MNSRHHRIVVHSPETGSAAWWHHESLCRLCRLLIVGLRRTWRMKILRRSVCTPCSTMGI